MFAGQSQSEVNHVFIIYHFNVVGCWVGLSLYHVDIDVREKYLLSFSSLLYHFLGRQKTVPSELTVPPSSFPYFTPALTAHRSQLDVFPDHKLGQHSYIN